MLMPEIYSFFFFFYIVGLGFLSNYFLYNIDTKALLRANEEKYPEAFIAERAYQHLKIINDFGPKVTGSRANEVLAANYILEQLKEIRKNATEPEDIFIDHQVASGYNKQYYFQNYHNIQNIVVRLQGKTDHAVMMNCHFDSVPGSPGASDNNVNCCTMMEILRVLSKSHNKQTHSIIFLFNGAEEPGLQGSHAFITQHKWRQDVRAYINLESTGSGGKSVLFRTGPKHDWLARMYRESVKKPFGTVAAEELFESGIIPSATDFQIFRDYGNVPGLDIAYSQHHWRYHTRYDSVDYIPVADIQHTGNDILLLLKKLANSKELPNPPEGNYPVFFEYLGLFFVSYSVPTAEITNYVVSVLAFLIPFLIQTKFKHRNVGFVFFETIIALVTMVISVVLSTLAVWGMAGIMNALDNTMSWFNTTFISIGIYGSLAVIVQIATYHAFQIISQLMLRTKKYREASKRHRVKINLNGVTLFWSIVTIVLTAKGFRSEYFIMVLLLVSLCTFIVNYATCRAFSKTTSQSWIFIHVFGHSTVFLLNCYLTLEMLHILIPVTGRKFIENPDLLIALLCVGGATLCLSYFIPLTLLLRGRLILYFLLGAVFVTYTTLAFTSSGFPYTDNKLEPRLQRFRTSHIKRTVYDSTGTAKSSFIDMLTYGWDRNSIRTIQEAFKEYDLKLAKEHELCAEIYNCGHLKYPIDNQAVSIGKFDVAPNLEPTKFNLLKSVRTGNVVDIEFSLELRTTIHFSLSIDEGLTFVSSNIAFSEVTQNKRKYYHGIVTVGLQKEEPYLVKIELKGGPVSDIVARFTVVTEDATFDQGTITPEYAKILSMYPDYTFSYVYQADSSTYDIKLN